MGIRKQYGSSFITPKLFTSYIDKFTLLLSEVLYDDEQFLFLLLQLIQQVNHLHGYSIQGGSSSE